MREITISGKVWRLAPSDPKILDAFLKWADTVIPDPFDEIASKIALFAPEIQKVLIQEAYLAKRQRCSWESPDVNALLHSVAGGYKIFGLRIQRNHPEITEAQCNDLFDSAAAEYPQEKLEELLT